jgi:succinate dehydrogenase/fumarate reductase flavoprotein subunit
MVARGARLRQESRGAHSRVDFQGEREEWGKYNIIIKRGDDGEMLVQREERTEPDPELAKIAFASIDDLEAGRV